MGRPLEAIIPEIDPKQVPPPEALLPRETIPVPDRWRLTDSSALSRTAGTTPTTRTHSRAIGRCSARTGSFAQPRVRHGARGAQVPTPIGAQSTRSAAVERPVRPQQAVAFVAEFHRSGCSLIKGDTAFKPPEIEFRFVPGDQLQLARTSARCACSTSIRAGARRATTTSSACRKPSSTTTYSNVSERYDFDSSASASSRSRRISAASCSGQPARRAPVRQPRQQPLAVQPRRAFRRLEKDTNSGLNEVGKPLRDDDVFIANLYRQDFARSRASRSQVTVVYNGNRESATSSTTTTTASRCARRCSATCVPHDYDVVYLGLQRRRAFRPAEPDRVALLRVRRRRATARSRSRRPTIARSSPPPRSRCDFDWMRVRGRRSTPAATRIRSTASDRLRRDVREPAYSPAPTRATGSARRCR